MMQISGCRFRQSLIAERLQRPILIMFKLQSPMCLHLVATDSAYTRTNSQCADAGGYDVVVSNIAGNRTSVVATLTVIAPPGIAAQPADQTIMAGQTATFTVTATNACGGPLNYQWQKAGANLSGA